MHELPRGSESVKFTHRAFASLLRMTMDAGPPRIRLNNPFDLRTAFPSQFNPPSSVDPLQPNLLGGTKPSTLRSYSMVNSSSSDQVVISTFSGICIKHEVVEFKKCTDEYLFSLKSYPISQMPERLPFQGVWRTQLHLLQLVSFVQRPPSR